MSAPKAVHSNVVPFPPRRSAASAHWRWAGPGRAWEWDLAVLARHLDARGVSTTAIEVPRSGEVELASVRGELVARASADGTYLALWSALEPVGLILASGLLVWMSRCPEERGEPRGAREAHPGVDLAVREDSWTAGSVWLGDELGWRGLWVTCFENLDGLEAALRRGRPAGLLWR